MLIKKKKSEDFFKISVFSDKDKSSLFKLQRTEKWLPEVGTAGWVK